MDIKFLFDSQIASAENRLTPTIDKYQNEGLMSLRARVLKIAQDVEITFFMNIESSLIDTKATKVIALRKEEIQKKVALLDDLIFCRAYHYDYNRIIREFYERLLSFCEKLLDGTHEALTDKETFIQSEGIIITERRPSEYTFSYKDRSKIKKLTYVGSSEILEKGFTTIMEQGHVRIENMKSFIYHCFECNHDNEIIDQGYFEFEWLGEKHLLTVLIGKLRNEFMISASNEDLENFVLKLNPRCKSRASIRKYLPNKTKDKTLPNSSEAQKSLKKKQIDYQLFIR